MVRVVLHKAKALILSTDDRSQPENWTVNEYFAKVAGKRIPMRASPWSIVGYITEARISGNTVVGIFEEVKDETS